MLLRLLRHQEPKLTYDGNVGLLRQWLKRRNTWLIENMDSNELTARACTRIQTALTKRLPEISDRHVCRCYRLKSNSVIITSRMSPASARNRDENGLTSDFPKLRLSSSSSSGSEILAGSLPAVLLRTISVVVFCAFESGDAYIIGVDRNKTAARRGQPCGCFQ